VSHWRDSAVDLHIGCRAIALVDPSMHVADACPMLLQLASS